MAMRMIDLIAKKRDGAEHTSEELSFVARAAAEGAAPDYQLSAWLMAVCCRGMRERETITLTREMAASGVQLDLHRLKAPKADKHSTGGVGDGVSLALAPLAAAAGLVVPMMSGRGLGHTGGTLDKLESIPGLRVSLAPEELRAQLARIGVAMFGQSAQLAPADRKLYALRDATATVESLPLVVSSILSKKAAEGLDALVLDVKVGSGAIFQDPAEAAELAAELVKVARGLGMKAAALLTAMDQPLGRYVGNALEVRQAVEVLKGDFTASDYVEVLLTLGGWMVHLAGKTSSPENGAKRLEALIRSGEAFERFKAMVAAQGGDVRSIEDLSLLPRAALHRDVLAPRSGFVSRLDARQVGEAAVLLGAGRSRMDQTLDYGAGLILDKKLGAAVKRGERVARLFAADKALLDEGEAHFRAGLAVSARAPRQAKVVRRILK